MDKSVFLDWWWFFFLDGIDRGNDCRETSGNGRKKGVVSLRQCTGSLKPFCSAKIDRTAVRTASAHSLFTRSGSFVLPSAPKA